ncbi:MAG: SMP-30/gluconolactonase/LRE family protein [Planctomycetia bacterium]|nr:SMP-30/gluconolactonase/LRE family protein [Planctomycetia bacterium]
MKFTLLQAALLVLGSWLAPVGVDRASAADAPPRGKFQPAAQDKIVPSGAKPELLWNEGEFTEGPAPAADGAILFSDIGNRIMRYDPQTGKTAVFRAPSGKSNGLKFNPTGQLVACEGAAPGGNRRISVTDLQGHVRTLADRFDGKRFNSPNDLAITTTGRVYFTDPRYVGDEPRELDFEAVFVVEPNGTVRVATRDVQKPNGIIVTPDDRTVYVADNSNLSEGNHQLVAFAVQSDGTLARKRMLHDFGPNRRGIDGMTLDRQSNIYATAGSDAEAGIYVFGPEGQHLAFIATPGDPSNCVFGIGKEASALYITGAGPQPAQNAGAKRPYALYRIGLTIPGYHVFPPATR